MLLLYGLCAEVIFSCTALCSIIASLLVIIFSAFGLSHLAVPLHQQEDALALPFAGAWLTVMRSGISTRLPKSVIMNQMAKDLSGYPDSDMKDNYSGGPASNLHPEDKARVVECMDNATVKWRHCMAGRIPLPAL